MVPRVLFPFRGGRAPLPEGKKYLDLTARPASVLDAACFRSRSSWTPVQRPRRTERDDDSTTCPSSGDSTTCPPSALAAFATRWGPPPHAHHRWRFRTRVAPAHRDTSTESLPMSALPHSYSQPLLATGLTRPPQTAPTAFSLVSPTVHGLAAALTVAARPCGLRPLLDLSSRRDSLARRLLAALLPSSVAPTAVGATASPLLTTATQRAAVTRLSYSPIRIASLTGTALPRTAIAAI